MNIFDNILGWFIFGSVIGSLAYIFEPNHIREGKPIMLGIMGATLTGILTSLILNIPLHQFSLISFIVALCGSFFFVLADKTLRTV